MTNDDALRTALTKLKTAMLGTTDGDLIDPDSEIPAGEMYRLAAEALPSILADALLAAHPAPETVAEMLAREAADAETMPAAEGPYVRNQPAPTPDTRREDVEAGAEAAWRASQGVNGFAEEQWAHVPEPQRASWRYIARAVLAVLPAPPVVDEAEIGARALDEAADVLDSDHASSLWEMWDPIAQEHRTPVDWLRDRAARLRGATR